MYFVTESVKAHCCSGGTAGTFWNHCVVGHPVIFSPAPVLKQSHEPCYLLQITDSRSAVLSVGFSACQSNTQGQFFRLFHSFGILSQTVILWNNKTVLPDSLGRR